MNATRPEREVETFVRLADRNSALRGFLSELLNPEQLGHAVTPEVRDRARILLGMPPVEALKHLAGDGGVGSGGTG